MRCEAVADSLPAVADGTTSLDSDARAHVEECLRCQAEVVQYRKLLRAMRAMRTAVLEPAPGMLAEILAGLHEVGERHAVRQLLSGRRVAYIGGLAAATAAGAGAVIVLAGRQKRTPRSRLVRLVS